MSDERTLAIWQSTTDQLRRVDLSSGYTFDNSKDLVDANIVGEGEGLSFERNFVRCAFSDVRLAGVKFHRVDYKDSSFIDCRFDDSDLGGGSVVSCTFANSTFDRCSFMDAALHDCRFIECTFIECSFCDSMIRNSTAANCCFDACQTSNKLFDGCRLYSNIFRGTFLDVSAIADNFGLDQAQIAKHFIRADRSRSETPFDFDAIQNGWNAVEYVSVFERIKLDYYLSGTGLRGGETLDLTFDSRSWFQAVRAPVNFERLLQDFADFLFRNYDQDRVSIGFILRLAQLAKEVGDQSTNLPGYAQITQAAAGIHLQCLQRLVYLEQAVASFRVRYPGDKLIFRSTDDISDEMAQEIADYFLEIAPSVKMRITPRNSPLDIIVEGLSVSHAIFLITLFFCTKLRLTLANLSSPREEGVAGEGTGSNEKDIFSLQVGGASGDALVQAFALSTGLTRGIVFKCEVKYSTEIIEKIRRFIKEVM